MHHSHHSDTLFIISEDDWRLREDEDVLPDAKLPKRGVWADPAEPNAAGDLETQLIPPPIADPRKLFGRPAEPVAAGGSAAASSSDPVSLSPGYPQTPGWARQVASKDIDFYARTSRPRDASTGFSETLTDIVKMCTFAHREREQGKSQGYGDFVWLSWRGRKGSKQHPSNGCTLFACTALGAQQIAEAMQFDVGKPNLLDLWFKDMGKHGLLHGSFIWPGLGDCATHVSESCSTTSTFEREGHWGANYVSQSTRVEERWLSKFMPDGEQKPKWIKRLWNAELENDSLVWLTLKPEGVEHHEDGKVTGLAPHFGAREDDPPLSKRAKRKTRVHLKATTHRRWTEDWLEALLACNMIMTSHSSFVASHIRVLCSGRRHHLGPGQLPVWLGGLQHALPLLGLPPGGGRPRPRGLRPRAAAGGAAEAEEPQPQEVSQPGASASALRRFPNA